MVPAAFVPLPMHGFGIAAVTFRAPIPELSDSTIESSGSSDGVENENGMAQIISVAMKAKIF
tara:strand:- start:3858 stop:4043 length:186 start_codon:yes stop_codon:yes gene_type:complete